MRSVSRNPLNPGGEAVRYELVSVRLGVSCAKWSGLKSIMLRVIDKALGRSEEKHFVIGS
jgi:hypothetical protein